MARGVGSAFGIATGGESAYDTADTITHVLPATGAATSAMNGDGFDYAGVADGYEESTNVYQTRYITPVTFNGPAMDTTLPILAAFALGSDTKSIPDTSGFFQHLITPIGVSSELGSTTLSVNMVTSASTTTGESVKHTGCVVDTFSFGGAVNSGAGELTCSATFQSSGTYADGVDISSATSSSKLFVFNEVYCGMQKTANEIPYNYSVQVPTDATPGPTYGEFTADYTAVGPYLQAFQWTVNNNLDVVGGHNTGSTLAANNMYRNQRVQDLSLTFRWSGEAATAGGAGSTTLIRDLRTNVFNTYSIALYGRARDTLQGATTLYRSGWTLIHQSARLMSVTTNPAPGIHTITANFRILNPADTGNSTNLYVWNSDNVDYL